MFRALVASLALASPAYANGADIGEIVDWPMAKFTQAIAGFPASQEEGRPQINFVLRRNKDGHTVAQFAETGFADDSVFGERQTYVLEHQADGRVKVLHTKVEYSCYRGATPRTWQSGLCP